MESHHMNIGQFHILRGNELREMYASSAIRALALALVSVFIPIYLFNLGYSLPQVFLFFAVENALHALFVIPAMQVIKKIGIKHAILGSKIFEICFFLLLYLLQVNDSLYVFALLLFSAGAKRALYFTALHLDLSKITRQGERGMEVGKLKFFTATFHALGPLIGGLLIVGFGFKFIFILASLLLLFSAAPLFLSREEAVDTDFSLKRIFQNRSLGDILAFIAYGIETGASGIIWSIFVFLRIVGDYGMLGLIATIASGVSLATDLVIGKFADTFKKKTIWAGSAVNAVIGLGRVFATTVSHAFAVNVISGLSTKMIYIPADVMTYEKANQEGALEYIMFREIVINAARAIFYGAMIFVSSLAVGLLAGALSSLLFMLF